MKLRPDTKAVLAFLDFLGDGLGVHAFQTYDDDKVRNDKARARTLIGTFDECCATLAAENLDRMAVHVTINETAGKARRAQNVISVRKHFVEIDGTMKLADIMALAKANQLAIAWINESSPGKYHVYFNVADDVARDLEGFTLRQKKLAKLFQGGRESVDLSRVLRLPGFYHQKGEPFMVRSVYSEPTATAHDVFDFELALADVKLDERTSTRDDDDGPGRDEDQAAIDAAIEHFKTFPVAISNTPNGPLGKKGNSQTFDAFARAKDLGCNETTALDLAWTHYNPRCLPPWSWDELETICANAYKYTKNAQGSKNPYAEAARDFGDEDETEVINQINAEIVARMAERQRKERKSKERGIGDNSGLVMTKAADVQERNIDYIWPRRLARGKHTVVAGEGGGGKTTITCDIVARVTNALAWPDGVGKAPLGSVLYLSAEDDLRDTLKPRMIAAGANLDKVYFIEAVKTEQGGERKLNLQEDLNRLKAACLAIGDVVLIVIDPASSYMGGNVDANSNTKVRQVLDPLSKLAQEVDCAILSITHFNKGTSGRAVNRVIESVAFTNAPRAAFGVFRDAGSKEQKESDFGDGAGRPTSSGQMLPIKINMGEWPTGIKFTIESATGGTDPRDNKPVATSRIVWGDQTTTSADEVVAAEQQVGRGRAPALSFAVDFLENTLSEGPRPPAEVVAEADAAGISAETLRRARRRLRIEPITLKGKSPPERLWALKTPMERRFDIDLSDYAGIGGAVSVPFMITQDMKQRLGALGYGPEIIANMTPQQAQDILAAATPASAKPERK